MSASRENISLQFGQYSNYVGSHFWNANADLECSDERSTAQLYHRSLTEDAIVRYSPRVLIFDLRGNLIDDTKSSFAKDIENLGGIWDQSVDVIKHDQHSSDEHITVDNDTATGSDKISNWTEFMRIPLSSKSYCEVPLFTDRFNQSYMGYKRHNFSNFLSGRSREIIPNGNRIDYFDSFRYMLEECDSLGNISVTVDFDTGFGGLACEILSEIREECPHTSVNVWAFGDGFETTAKGVSSTDALALPLMYASLCPELASIVIPIDKSQLTVASKDNNHSSTYLSSSIAAAVYDTITSSDRKNTSASSAVEATNSSINCESWVHTVSCGGQFPIASVETCLPWPITSEDSLQPLLDTFHNPSSNNIQKYKQNNINTFDQSFSSNTFTFYPQSLNPFMKSLSLFPPKLIRTTSSTSGTNRAFSNFLSFRTPVSKEFTSSLYAQCLYSSYLISRVSQRNDYIFLPTSCVNAFHMDTAELYEEDFYIPCPAAAAVGIDGTSISRHLEEVANGWLQSSRTCSLLLQKYDIEGDEVKDIHQMLMELGSRYLNSS